MRGMISPSGHLRRGLEIDGRSHANIIIMRVEESTRGAPAIDAEHLEEVKVSIEPARRIQSLGCPGKLNPMNVDASVLPWAGSACELAFVDQLSNECNPAKFQHKGRIERNSVDRRRISS